MWQLWMFVCSKIVCKIFLITGIAFSTQVDCEDNGYVVAEYIVDNNPGLISADPHCALNPIEARQKETI